MHFTVERYINSVLATPFYTFINLVGFNVDFHTIFRVEPLRGFCLKVGLAKTGKTGQF